MNGQTPDIHGFPVRLIVPGWDGTSSVKWVVRISATAQASAGFFMNPAYRYPKYALPPGTPARPGGTGSDRRHAGEIVASPRRKIRSKVALGPMTIRGFAWAGENAIERVEVSTDGGSRWRDAQLSAAETALRLAAVEPGLAAQRARLLHHHVARHRYRRPRAADRFALEPLGLLVERHRPRGSHGGEKRMRAP